MQNIVLCILDGLGIAKPSEHNAFHVANTPYFDFLFKNYPHSLIKTSGNDVGLPEGQMGNSEVGHMTIAAGRVILQDLVRINSSIEDNSIIDYSSFDEFAQGDEDIHIMGLFSDGGVHSHLNHIIYLVEELVKKNKQIYLHIFADGRDTSPYDLINNVEILNRLTANKNIKIASLSGRYYAMDRDNRWDRTKAAYSSIIHAKGDRFESIEQAIKHFHQIKCCDEFIKPCIIGSYEGVKDNDKILMANFRSDRAIQILLAIFTENFDKFNRGRKLNISRALGMVRYSNCLNQYISSLFEPINLTNILPEIIKNNNLTQLRLAETEKYPHVTYFFSGGSQKIFAGEDRILIESKKVATYDLYPQMSAFEITSELEKAIESEKYNIIVVNFANCDMVGHSGDFEKTVLAIETIDKCLSQIHELILEKKLVMVITSDHGNAEEMFDKSLNLPHTAHSLNPVPLILVGHDINDKVSMIKDGILSDIAPTILDLMYIKKPIEMTGNSLILKNQ